jgi:hypothetical protein
MNFYIRCPFKWTFRVLGLIHPPTAISNIQYTEIIEKKNWHKTGKKNSRVHQSH